MNNAIRNGNFNSSEIVALTSMSTRDMTQEELVARPKKGVGSRTTTVEDRKSFGDAAITFIEECNVERRLGRSITDECNARALSWGKLVERRVFDILPTDYDLRSLETLIHPTIEGWVGSPDGFHYWMYKAVCDFKCPLTLKSFCRLVDLWNMGGMDAIRFGLVEQRGAHTIHHKKHPDGEKFYWQLVSNAAITGCDHAELIVYAPYKSELEIIRELARNIDVANPFKFKWISDASDDELPFLIDGGHYKNVNVMRFEVPFLDKQFLTERVLLAKELLVPVHVTENVMV
jgi:hypothetical protein